MTRRMKTNRYHDMLRTEIREFVCLVRFMDLNEMVVPATSRELELETQQQ